MSPRSDLSVEIIDNPVGEKKKKLQEIVLDPFTQSYA
jgi:hypothetical protein